MKWFASKSSQPVENVIEDKPVAVPGEVWWRQQVRKSRVEQMTAVAGKGFLSRSDAVDLFLAAGIHAVEVGGVEIGSYLQELRVKRSELDRVHSEQVRG